MYVHHTEWCGQPQTVHISVDPGRYTLTCSYENTSATVCPCHLQLCPHPSVHGPCLSVPPSVVSSICPWTLPVRATFSCVLIPLSMDLACPCHLQLCHPSVHETCLSTMPPSVVSSTCPWTLPVRATFICVIHLSMDPACPCHLQLCHPSVHETCLSTMPPSVVFVGLSVSVHGPCLSVPPSVVFVGLSVSVHGPCLSMPPSVVFVGLSVSVHGPCLLLRR